MTTKDDLDAVSSVAAAYFSANPVPKEQIIEIISLIRDGLNGTSSPSPALPSSTASQASSVAPKVAPAVPVEDSVHPDHLVCLICGKSQKTIRRHLRSVHGVEGAQYLNMFGLPKDYPFAAPLYAESRAQIARSTTDVRLRRTPQTPSEPVQQTVDPIDDFDDTVYDLNEMFKETPTDSKKKSSKAKRSANVGKGAPAEGVSASFDEFFDNMTPEQAQQLLDTLAEMDNQLEEGSTTDA